MKIQIVAITIAALTMTACSKQKEASSESAKEAPTPPAKETPTPPAKESPTAPTNETPTAPTKETPTVSDKELPLTPAQEALAKTEWENVNSLDPQSLQSFLKAYSSGILAQHAREALELHELIKKIKGGTIAKGSIITFEEVGGGDAWASPGDVGFTGYGATRGNGATMLTTLEPEPFRAGKTPGLKMRLLVNSGGNPCKEN